MADREPEQQLQGRAAEAFALLSAGLEALRELPPEMLTDPHLLLSNQLLFTALQQMESIRLGHLRELDGRPGAIPTSRAGTVAKTFSTVVLKRTPAHARTDVKAAHALDPARPAADGGLPELAAAFAEGEVSVEHVKVAVATMRKVPAKFLGLPAEQVDEEAAPGLTGGDLIDASLTSSAKALPPQSTEKVSARLLHMLDPEGFQRFDEHAHERRGLTWSIDSTGMICGRFTLDPVSGLKAVTVLNALAAPRPAREEKGPDGSVVAVVDPRSASARLADAFTEAMERTAATILAPLDSSSAGPALITLPTTPVQTPAAPAAPAGPAPAVAPTAPVAPAVPTEPVAAAVPTAPVAPAAPVAPTVPTVPTAPVAPAAPVAPTAPTAPTAPVAPGVPTAPVAPTAPATAAAHLFEAPQGAGDGTSAHTVDPTGPVQTMRARKHPRSMTPRILITTTPEQLRAALHPAAPESPPGSPSQRLNDPPDPIAADAQHYGPLGQPHLAALACDATLQRVLLAPDGAVMNLGRAVRTVSPAQKLALAARDRGCVIPGCTLPADWCDAHHVTPWSEGGASDVGNYALLCTPHHQQVHAGVWELTMREGVPWVRPPAWMAPQRRPIRNTFTDHHDQASELARALTGALTELAAPSGTDRPGLSEAA